MAKKSIQKKKKNPKASPVISRVKKLAKGIVSAMGTKAKKAQTKAPAKSPAKPASKAPVKTQKTAPKTAPKNPPKGPQKQEKQGKKDQVKPGKSGKPVQPETVQTSGKQIAGKQPEGKHAGVKPAGQKGPQPGGKPPKVLKPHPAPGHANDRMCRESGCENQATTKGYCRLDYIKNWKKIKRKEMILKEGKLNQYIEELVSKYPDKYIEVIRQDLSTEVNFTKVIHDLELDETMDDLDYDSDSIDSLIGSIRKEDDIDDTEF